MTVSVTQVDLSAMAPGSFLHAPQPLSHIGIEMSAVKLMPIPEVMRPPAMAEDELILQLGGAAQLSGRIERRFQTHVRPGTLFIVPRGTPTEWRIGVPYSVLNLYLMPALLRQLAHETLDVDPSGIEFVPLAGFDDQYLAAAGFALLAAVQAHPTNDSLAVDTLAYAMMVYLLRHYTVHKHSVPRMDGKLCSKALCHVIEYIHGHLGHALTLTEIAGIARLSPYHFARQFRATVGLSPHQYVLEQRLAAARQMLNARLLPLADIASSLGFSDQSHFGSHFKRRYGVSPGALTVASS